MEIPFRLVITILVSLHCSLIKCFEVKNEFLEKNHARCVNFSTTPYFDFKHVTGKPWRVYYSWDMELGNTCIDLKFKKATPVMVERFFREMAQYLEKQPMWEAGKLVMQMGTHQMMLFLQFAPVGMFSAVANVARDSNLARIRGVLPLVEFFMKHYRDGKYLFILDCKMGVASLSSRFDNPPDRAEIEAVAKEIGMDGEGEQACLQDQNAIELLDRFKSKI